MLHSNCWLILSHEMGVGKHGTDGSQEWPGLRTSGSSLDAL